MNEHEKINYLEFPVRDFDATKAFFGQVFGWEFVDYGEDYVAFSNAGIEGGFYRSQQTVSPENGSVLIVFYSEDLEATQSKILAAGGTIVKETFLFPGGRRLHFADPNGNEFSVWTDREPSQSR